MNNSPNQGILTALDPYKEQLLTRLTATLRISALDNRGVLTSPRRAPKLAEQIGGLWFAILSATAGPDEVEQLSLDLVKQGLTYVTASRAMQTLRQTVLEVAGNDASLKLDILLVLDDFVNQFLKNVAIAREVSIIREQEQYQASLQQVLQDRLQSEHILGKKLDQRQKKLQNVINIYSSISILTDETEILNSFVALAQEKLMLAGVAVLELASNEQVATVRAAAGQIPDKFNLHMAQEIRSDSLLEQTITQNQLVLKASTAAENEVKYEIVAPLSIGQHIIGMLALWTTETDLSEDDLEYVRPLAITLTDTWQNAHLLAQAEERANELEMLQGQQVRATWQRAESLVRRAHIYDGVDVRTEVVDLQSRYDSDEFLTLPIRVRDLLVGKLTVPVADRKLSEDDIAFTEMVIGEMAKAIENANLIQDTQRRTYELAVLNELGQALAARLNVGQVLEATYWGASNLLDASNLSIGLYNSATDEVEIAFTTNQLTLDQQATTMPASRGITGYIIRNRTSLLIPENLPERLAELGIDVVGKSSLSFLGVPIIAGDQVLGRIIVQSFTTPGVYNEQDRELLIAVANQTAIALQNAGLFEQTQRRVYQEQTIREITEKMQTAVNLEELVKITATQLGERLSAGHAIINLGIDDK